MKSLPSYKKILVINIFGVGDVLFTTPLLRNIKLALPGVTIGYVCNKRTVDLLFNNPDIHRVHVYEKDDFENLWKKSKVAFLKRIAHFFDEIKKQHYDLVIDVSLNKYSSFFALVAGIKERVGFDYKKRGFWLTKKTTLMGYEGKHVVDFYLDFLTQLGIPAKERHLQVSLSSEDVAWAKQFLQAQGVKPSDRLVAVVPGGGASWGKTAEYKRWPAKRYAKLADKVIEKYHAKIILIGDDSEQALCQDVVSDMTLPCIKSFGKTTLGQFAALLEQCSLAIVNDGGPLHLAVALGVRTISLFGPVDEHVYGPYPKDNHETVVSSVSCRPCYRRFRVADCGHHQCLQRISVEDVLSRIGELR